MKSFRDKVAVVTGGGSGIGRGLALQLNRAGARLALCDLDRSSLEETGTRIMLENPDHHTSLHVVDVSDQVEMQRFAARVIAEHGQVDVLINNAGITLSPTPFTEISDQQFKKIVDVNLWGVYYGVRAFLPYLMERPEASIISISSLAGLIGLAGYSPYAISKFGIRALSESLAMELSGTNIHVMVVHPGGVKTNIIRNAPNLSEDERETAHQAFTKLAFLSADKAAEKILRAAQKKRYRLILGADARIAYLIRRLFPQRYLKILNAVFGRMNFG